VLPTLIREEGVIREGDVVIHTNYREDRARELTEALAVNEFSGFEREHKKVHYVCMVEYDSQFNLPVAYPWEVPSNTLGEHVSALGGSQLRIAETEKYAHVTYFFNGGREEPFPGEARVLIASDRSVATYDLQPAMKTMEIASTAAQYVRKHRPDLVVCNIAAPDMVGHTGNFDATVRALEVTDKAVGVIADCCKEEDYVLVITADHGNCEEMKGSRKTSHTLNPVPVCVVEHDAQGEVIRHKLIDQEKGVLGDIAPTILKMIDAPIPAQMTRPGLIE
jgi:2,3-bisphosphoglycerate-independent phosphoglycerate mutase